MSVERLDASTKDVRFDFSDLEAEVFELVGVDATAAASLTAGHGMNEVAASAVFFCQCSCCFCS